MRTRAIEDADCDFFSKYARAEDVAECLSVTKLPLSEHIRVGRDNSQESYVLVDDHNRPCALYGIMLDKSGFNIPWLLTTVFVEKHKLSFMKEVHKVVKKWYKKYGPLWLLTDLRYERAIKLNLWVGFKRVGEPVSVNGVDFGLFKFSGDKK